MTPTDHDDFVARFMADYYAESEEHLAEIRASLVALDQGVGGETPRHVIDDLFRNCHSLKGISAIAEIRDGEELAHEMESYLRAIRAQDVTLTAEGMDALVAAAAAFEQLLAARRGGEAPPMIAVHVERLRALEQRRGASPAGSPAPAAATPTNQAPRWKVTFSPSPSLVARDVKVDAIRERLLRIGHIEHVAPRVVEGGRIVFDFIVATADEAALRGWADDGVTYEAATSAPSLPSAAAPAASVQAASTHVRVELSRLDDLMRFVGDMVVTRSRMDDVLQRAERAMPSAEWRLLTEYCERLERQLRALREGVMRVRLVPVGEIFRRMPLVVRDLARDSGKHVQLEITGQQTEIDKFLIERMLDPVLHLVRNAVSHGIETADERREAGKPLHGTVRLSATTIGEAVLLEIADDGRGLDRAAIATRAAAAGIEVPPDGQLRDQQLLDVICAPGFTTRDEADRISGRGVGMAVVRDTVRDLGGTLELSTESASGTTFRITLPLTLAITDALLVTVGDHQFAVPQGAVREVIEVAAGSLTTIEANELLVHRGLSMPVLRLARLFGIEAPSRARMHALVVGSGTSALGLLVDRISGQREIVVKTVADPLIRVDGVTGVTELGDGSVILIVDVGWLAQQGRGRHHAGPAVATGR